MGNTMNACNYTMADHNIMNSCSSCNGCYQHQIHQQQQPCHIPSNNPHNPTNYNYNVHPTYSHNNIGYNLNENISSSASNTSSCDTNNCQYPSTYYQDSRPTTTTYYPQNQTQNQLQNVNFNQVQQIVPFPRYSNANNLNIPSMPQQQLQQQAQRTPSIAPIFPTQPSISSISAIPIISDITPPRPKKRAIAQILADGQNDEENTISAPTGPTPPKKQKLERKKRTTPNTKLSEAVEQLQQFSDNHGGKLPSLRYVMKMLKVGFPKAHEIIDCFAEEIGQSKEQVVQNMTVRQESEKKINAKNKQLKQGRKRKKVQITKGAKHESIDTLIPPIINLDALKQIKIQKK